MSRRITSEQTTVNIYQRFGTAGAPIASAPIVDLDAATGDFIHITGSATIESFIISNGLERTLRFDGTPLIKHSHAGIQLPDSQDYQCAAGDVLAFRGDGTNVAVCVNIQKKITKLAIRFTLADGSSSPIPIVPLT